MTGIAGSQASAQFRRLNRDQITAIQSAKLASMAEAFWDGNAFYREKLKRAGFGRGDLRSLDDLARVPFTTKAELVEDQDANPPYGTNLSFALSQYVRLHQTSGTKGSPMRWLDTTESWEWLMRLWEVIYHAAGIMKEDIFFFPFSFGPFLGFWTAFEAAIRAGCLTLAGGAMTTPARLRFMLENKATVIGCTPTYALHMAETAASEGIDLAASSVRALVVAGEPGGNIPETRRRIEEAWGARCFDHWGMTEVGSLGFEAVEAPGGIHLIETECIAEVIDPATGAPAPSGARGELVITNLGRWGSPLLRYRTGDLVQIEADPKSDWNFIRFKGGVLGRVDDMIIVRGNNLYPSALESILRRFPEIAEYRAEVSTQRGLAVLTLTIECSEALQSNGGSLHERIISAVKDSLNFRPEVQMVGPGTLPRFEMKAARFIIHPS